MTVKHDHSRTRLCLPFSQLFSHLKVLTVLVVLACNIATVPAAVIADEHVNVLWIYVDDMSDWVGCYGDSIVQTPNIDKLASGGVRFTNAFMPSPVCSTTRSALITGTMQTTYGLHHHRTMIKKPLPDSLKTVPELFREAGYLTFNEAKDDYNFTRDRKLMYSPEFRRPGKPRVNGHLVGRDLSWLKQLQGKLFFGQIQLKGGKFGGETGSKYPAETRFSADAITVPPQYPDHPVIRNAIARHYEQIVETDEQVGAIMDALKEYELWDNTVVFFFTDHGCPLPRAKQFLYEDGTKVPLIVRWPHGEKPKSGRIFERTDLVNGIDISATTVAIGGIPIPKTMEGRNLFATIGRQSPKYVISARDRLGNAVDRIRAVRSERYRYIRNYKTDRALYQPQYREAFPTFVTLRELHSAGKLTPLQASYHNATQRPAEEFYDLETDPHQTDNLAIRLADDPKYSTLIAEHRDYLQHWEKSTDDKGRYPESEESLRLVFKAAKGKCVAPEFDFINHPRKSSTP